MTDSAPAADVQAKVDAVAGKADSALKSAASGVKSTAAAVESAAHEANQAASTDAKNVKGLIARFKKDDGSVDIEKVLKEVVAPVAVVGALLLVGVAAKNAHEDSESGESDGPVSSALSVFKAKSDEAADKAVKSAEKAGKEVERASKKVTKEAGEVAAESKNLLQELRDWMAGLFGKK